MQDIVDDTMISNRTDFTKYDCKSLADYEGDFLWYIGESHTRLYLLDSKKLGRKARRDERTAWNLFKELGGEPYYSYGDRIYYYEDKDNHFGEITKDAAKGVYTGYLSDARSILLEQPIKRTCSFGYLRDQIRFSDEHGGNLRQILDHLRRWVRTTSLDRIELYKDWADHSFGFCEVRKDGRGIAGGVIYRDGNWSIHT